MAKLLRITKTIDFMVRLPEPPFGGEPHQDEISEAIDDFVMNIASDMGQLLSEDLLIDVEAEIEVEDVHVGGTRITVEEN